MIFYHNTPVQLRFNDIDMLGHATNSVFQQYFDLGKMGYFQDVFEEVMNWQTEGLIMVNINVSYVNPIKLYDEVEVKTKVVKLGNKSLEMLQQVFNQTSGQVAAESKSVMVGYCGKSEKSILLPEGWRKKIADFETDLVFEL